MQLMGMACRAIHPRDKSMGWAEQMGMLSAYSGHSCPRKAAPNASPQPDPAHGRQGRAVKHPKPGETYSNSVIWLSSSFLKLKNKHY